jgi:hypothetical protein
MRSGRLLSAANQSTLSHYYPTLNLTYDSFDTTVRMHSILRLYYSYYSTTLIEYVVKNHQKNPRLIIEAAILYGHR